MIVSEIYRRAFAPSSTVTISALRNESPGISSAFVIGWLWGNSVDARISNLWDWRWG